MQGRREDRKSQRGRKLMLLLPALELVGFLTQLLGLPLNYTSAVRHNLHAGGLFRAERSGTNRQQPFPCASTIRRE